MRDPEVKLLSRDPYELMIVVPYLPTRLNKLLGASKFTNMRHAAGWRNLIGGLVTFWRPHQPLTHATLTLRRYSWRALDYDSLVQQFKAPVDALKRAGVIVDDRWSVTGKWDVDQDYAPRGLERIVLNIKHREPSPEETTRAKKKRQRKPRR